MAIRNLYNFASDGFDGFVKNGIRSFISVCIIAFSLFLLGIFLLFFGNIKLGIEGLRKSIPVFIFFSENISITDVQEIKSHLEKKLLVSYVNYISPGEALKQFIQGTSIDVFQDSGNPFPPFLEVYPKQEYSEKQIKSFAEKLRKNPYTESVEYDGEWAIRIEALVKIWDYLVYFVGFAFFVTVAFIISNSVDISIQNHRLEMDVVRWVGGSNWVMGAPFLIEGIIQAVLGSALSFLFLYTFFVGFIKISSGFIKSLLPNSSIVFLPPVIITKIVLIAITVGAFGSFISIFRFINMRKIENYR